MAMLFRVSFLFIAVLLAACASNKPLHVYHGAVQPDEALVTLRVPETLHIITLDNQHFRKVANILSSGQREIKLLPGSHALSAEYKKIWDTGREDHESIRSDPIWIGFEAKAGDVIELTHPATPNLETSKAVSNNLQVTAINRTTGATTFSQAAAFVTPLPYSMAVANAQQLQPVYQQPVPVSPTVAQAEPEPVNKKPVVNKASENKSSAIISRSEPQRANTASVDELQQLKLLWEKASVEERKAFQNWVFSR